MFETLIEKIGIGILTIGTVVSSWFGVTPQQPVQNLGSTFTTPDTRALFTTTLASKITSTATSMTLTSATDKDGNTLASSTYGFIIDEGTSVEEFVLADCTGTTCTNMTRGISVATATTSVASLQFEHRRGASVKITTSPSVVFLMNVMKGRQNIENVLRYNSAKTFNNATDIISRDYADALAFGAVPAASETASGFVELATAIEMASTTSSGSAARLVIPASLATSTYNSATAGLKAVITQNNGKIDNNFISTSTLFSSSTFSTGTTTIAGSLTLSGGNSSSNIASTSIYATTTSGTWTKPSNLRYMIVEVVGGGGGGFGANGDSNGSGGGGGGYSKEILLNSQIGSTETVTIGAGGSGGNGASGNNGGTTSFGSHLQATGGTGGAVEDGGGIGGTGSGGDINLKGEDGESGNGNTASEQLGGSGGSSFMGGGGKGQGDANGMDGGNYGGGGGGSGRTSGTGVGGNGAAGIVIFTYVFY